MLNWRSCGGRIPGGGPRAGVRGSVTCRSRPGPNKSRTAFGPRPPPSHQWLGPLGLGPWMGKDGVHHGASWHHAGDNGIVMDGHGPGTRTSPSVPF